MNKNMNIKLVQPNEKHEEAYTQMMEVWEGTGEQIQPSAIIRAGMKYDDWLKHTRESSSKEKLPQHLVPASTYFLVDEHNSILGAINIRHELNEYLLDFGGHIGYGVHPNQRRKGYAKLMLKLGLEECRRLNITKILLTCDKVNVASAKTILANGGVLENEVEKEDGTITQRYWITEK